MANPSLFETCAWSGRAYLKHKLLRIDLVIGPPSFSRPAVGGRRAVLGGVPEARRAQGKDPEGGGLRGQAPTRALVFPESLLYN